jgi:hypothetical protein
MASKNKIGSKQSSKSFKDLAPGKNPKGGEATSSAQGFQYQTAVPVDADLTKTPGARTHSALP